VDVDVLDPHLSDHYAIFLGMQYIEKIKVDSVIWTRQMTTNNLKYFCENLHRVDWGFVNTLYTAKEKFKWFFEKNLKIFYQCCPKKWQKINNNTENQLWFGEEHKLKICITNSGLHIQQASTRQRKTTTYSKLIENSNNKSSTIWKIVKSLNGVHYHETVPHLTADRFQQLYLSRSIFGRKSPEKIFP
jgi:hypothetical protein